MTTTVRPAATRPPDTEQLAARLIGEIELYLATQALARPAPVDPPAEPGPAHPLLTKTTVELVAEALGQPTTAPAPGIAPPPRWLRILPDWALPLARSGPRRAVSVAQHLDLTALVIERYGWCGRGLRTRSGRRCILGAQAALYRLGYGDHRTATAAGQHMQNILSRRGIDQPYHQWNDGPDRDAGDVLHLIRTAANEAREDSR